MNIRVVTSHFSFLFDNVTRITLPGRRALFARGVDIHQRGEIVRPLLPEKRDPDIARRNRPPSGERNSSAEREDPLACHFPELSLESRAKQTSE